MKQKVNSQFILVLSISLALIACNQQDEQTTKTTDSTDVVETEAVQPSTQDAALDAVKVSPNLYKVVSDTMGIRVLEVTYKPGDSSALQLSS